MSEEEESPVFSLDPQRLLRIAAVTREVLAETRRIRPEPQAVDHLRQVHERICHELEHALPPDLYQELSQLTPDLHEDSKEELALAHAEILGWLGGLFQGARLAAAAQTSAATPKPVVEEATASPAADPEHVHEDPRYL